MIDPREAPCPNCQAPAGKPCNVPKGNGRRDVPWFHSARENLAAGVTPASPAQTLAETLLATLQDDPTVTMIACDCGRDVDIFTDQTAPPIQELIEHAAFEHTSRREINVYRTVKLLSGYEIGTLLRLDAQTEAEKKWREDRA